MFSTAGVVTAARAARTCDHEPMRHRLAFPTLALVLTAWAGACTSFGSDTAPSKDDAAGGDDASATATVSTSLPGDDGGGVPPGGDAGGDALSPGWGAAFVSARTTKGNLGNMQVKADELCTEEGRRIRPNAKFAALLVRTASDTLFTRAESSGPRYLPNGDGSQGRLAIANVASGVGPFDVRVYADGGEVGAGLRVWTGAPNDAGAILNCSSGEGAWATESSGFQGATGSTSAGAPGYALSTCDQSERLFCVEVGNFR